MIVHETPRKSTVCRTAAASAARSTTSEPQSAYWCAQSEKAARHAEAVAREMGFSLDWPGLWPTLRRIRGDSTYDIYLPDC